MTYSDLIAHERPMTLPAAAKEFGRISGRTPHVATVWRWCSRGVRGVRLESLVIGGTRLVTQDAIDRFLAATNGKGATANPGIERAVAESHEQSRRRAEIEAARSRLTAKCGSLTSTSRRATTAAAS